LHQEVDYTVDEKSRTASLTDAGISNVEAALKRDGLLKSPNLYDPQNHSLMRYLDNALKAHVLFKRDREYVVKDGEVIIVDEFTGRLMPGRRYSEGLHQALEAKERVKIQRESMTFATITFQNYFRMYNKLAGMTGTAITEAEEFHRIYNLDAVVIPTNMPMVRQDFSDRIYSREEAKFHAVVREVEELHQQQQPVLIGTVSIEKSEMLSDMLKRRGIPHQVLNAKYHEREAVIITQAGRLGAVTVATNMAGRGVDIVLGGTPEERDEKDWQQEHQKVVELGGVHILGTERHEARRIDNQLRGRSGRQGDPGSSRFYVSLEDDIMRRFGGDRVKGFLEWAGMDEDTPIENKLVTRSIENAQVRVEGFHFDIRKHLVEYDDVANQQREIIYAERKKILSEADLKANILSMVEEEIQGMVAGHFGDGHSHDGNIEGLLTDVSTLIPPSPDLNAEALSRVSTKEIQEKLVEQAKSQYEQKEQEIGPENMRALERLVMLRTIDSLWVEHLTAMEQMRQEAGWQSLRQIRPVDAYRNQGYRQFQLLLETIKHDVARTIFHVGLVKQEIRRPVSTPAGQAASRQAGGSPILQRTPVAAGAASRRPKAGGKKIGRNDPCPCGSGKKYKHCCGR
jgi:preprotein translocase subunit SecA